MSDYPQPTSTWVPAAYERNAHAAFVRAYEMNIAVDRLHFFTNNNSSLPAAQIAQRQAILDIARKLLVTERDKAMDYAVLMWTKFRTFNPANSDG